MSSSWAEFVSADGIPYYYNQVTGESRWDKPPELMSTDESDTSGDWHWMPHEYHGYLPARLLATYGDGSMRCETEDFQQFDIDKAWAPLRPLIRSQLKKLTDDLVRLEDMSEPLIIHNLRERAKTNNIYTNVGTILISINPYKQLPLYTPSVMDQYAHNNTDKLPPHVFTIAKHAYTNMVEWKTNHSVIISGESGAGKTEATKQILQYLAEVAGSTSGVEQNILSANPILESFGNAKTVRNNNSSRFGKWVEIHFDSKFRIVGARNVNYLLEKSRVCKQAPNERNYHIFYQLCQGADAAAKKTYSLQGNLQNYNFLNQSGTIDIPGVNDSKDFADTTHAMNILQFTPDDQKNLFSTVAAVLSLGNLLFSADDEKSSITNNDVLKIAASLLQVEPAKLSHALTHRIMVIRGQDPMTIPLNQEKAIDARDSLAQSIYGWMFDWLVGRINKFLSAGIPTSKTHVIGVLDIFGFEIFEKNSFEQLCINFANEKLQQHFNAQTFKLEEAVYQSEKIQYEHVEFIDNQVVLDLIEKKPSGILCILDEEIVMPKASDSTFLQKLHQKHQNTPRYIKPRLAHHTSFCIKHYAGEVNYLCANFLDKNKDTLHQDLYDVILSSKNTWLAGLVPDTKAKKVSLGGQFKDQLNSLMDTLNATEPHYVRCIKPNQTKTPVMDELEGGMVLRQLTYAGVFEAVSIRQKGFPFRYSHRDFYVRYRMLAKVKGNGDKDLCQKLLKAIPSDMSGVQIGVTKVLYRAEQYRTLELLRNVAMEKASIQVQSSVRAWIARRFCKRLSACRKVLRDAIQSRNLDKLNHAIDKQVIEFELKELKDAKKLREVVIEEIRLTKLINELLPKIMNQDDPPQAQIDQLRKAVSDCQKINFASKEAKNATEKLENIDQRIETRKQLQEGVKNSDEETIQKFLQLASKLGIKDSESSVSAAKQEVERIQKEKEVLRSLKKALSLPDESSKPSLSRNRGMSQTNIERKGSSSLLPRQSSKAGLSSVEFSTLIKSPHIHPGITIGERGEVTLNDDAKKDLEKAFAEAKKFNCKTPEGKQLVTSADLVLKNREHISKDSWDLVEKELTAATALDIIETPEIRAAHEQLLYRANVAEVQQKLEEAYYSHDVAGLEFGLDKAEKLNMDAGWARDMLNYILETNQALEQAIESVELEALEHALAMADQIQYQKEEVSVARKLRDQVAQLIVEIDEILVTLETREKMQGIYDRATSIRMRTEPLDKLGGLLQLSEEELLKLMLKAAIALNDEARRVKLSIRMKEIFFARFGDTFVLNQSKKLKSPGEFARGKLFGKDALMEGFLKWSKEPIHTSLTQLELIEEIPKEHLKQLTKQATKIHKNILGFCGDRQLSYPTQLAKEVLQKGLEEPHLRDEIYCQLVKQLSSNPTPSSVSQGWKLMRISLTTFPPSEEFENYLEMWLKRAGQGAEGCIDILHTTTFRGAKTAPPSEAEIENA